MAETVANAIIEVQRHFNMSDAVALEYLNKADRYITLNIPLRWDTEEVILVAGTAEVALSTENIIKCWQARYRQSSTSSYTLTPTDVTKLDMQDGDWRALPNDEPSEFTIKGSSTGAASILLTNTPATSTSPATTAGFPRVTIYVTKAAVLTTNDSLPAMLGSSDIYTFRAAWRYACEFAKDQEDYYWKKWERALKEEWDLYRARTAYQPKEFLFDFGGGGPV